MTSFREHVVGTVVENRVHRFLPAPLPWKSSSTCSAGSTVKVNLDVTGFVKSLRAELPSGALVLQALIRSPYSPLKVLVRNHCLASAVPSCNARLPGH